MRIPHNDITVITKTRKFSNEVVHLHDKECETEYFGLKYDWPKDHYFEMEVHANAKYKGLFECVLVKIREPKSISSSFEGTIFISVRDISGVKKFPRSFTILDESQLSKEDFKKYGLSHEYRDSWLRINYIKRDTLLNEAEELLPDDTLTLEIEIYPNRLTRNDIAYFNDFTSVANSSLKIEGNEYYLLLDSPLADILSKESLFFQRLRDTQMLEGDIRRLNISFFEYLTFKNIAEMLLCDTYLIINNVAYIFDMYFVADKYDIPVVSETCVIFLKLCLSGKSTKDLWNLTVSTDISKRVSRQNLVSKVCSELEEENEEDIPPEQRIRRSGWIYKNEKFHPEYGTYGLLFENPYKSDLYFYK